ncbi:MAG: hypothetical protein ACXADS_04300 [Candidatus Thorarchaeota archaeon]|jgi:membrane-associated phospholipid phosphatase
MSILRFGDEGLEFSGRGTTSAQVVSRLTPAPLVNLYVGAIMAYSSPIGLGPIFNPVASLSVVTVIMVIMPIVPIVFEAWRGRTDLDVSARESRPKFLAFSLLCYALAFAIFGYASCPVLQVLAAAYFTVTLGVLVASFWTKVSVHGAGVGGPGTALLIVYGWPAFPVVLLWGLVIWSRTKLKQHSLLQATAGVLIGILITLPTYALLYPV